jgi:hypothetical protein
MEYRLGPALYKPGGPWSQDGKSLQIADDVRQCVVFLGWQEAGPIDSAPIKPQGTGFFISGAEAFDGQVFIVTARHVVEKLHPPFVIRINDRAGGARLFHIDRPSDIDWQFHPDDESVDLAVAPLQLPSWAKARGINAPAFLKDREKLKLMQTGALVYVIGLYHLRYGTQKNLPITHVGYIAMLPEDERVRVEGVDREAYLIQSNAISGCSGAPVLVNPSIRLTINNTSVFAYDNYNLLLGVWSASWKVKGSEVVAVKNDEDESGTMAPLGMGVVTPVSKLIDILWSESMKKAITRLRKKIEAERSPTPDAASGAIPPASDENPTHREDFTRLVGAAARTRVRED